MDYQALVSNWSDLNLVKNIISLYFGFEYKNNYKVIC